VTKKGEWVLEARVIALRGLSGNHGGKNLGRYVVGLCDRVGLMGSDWSKVRNVQLTVDEITDKHHHSCTAQLSITPPLTT
jgi:hypothetical protein